MKVSRYLATGVRDCSRPLISKKTVREMRQSPRHGRMSRAQQSVACPPKGDILNREQSWELMCTWTESDSLRKHMLAVEAAMRAYARRFGEDEEKWGITGLLHDMDYEKHPTPDEHPMVGVRELESRGYPEDIIHAIK